MPSLRGQRTSRTKGRTRRSKEVVENLATRGLRSKDGKVLETGQNLVNEYTENMEIDQTVCKSTYSNFGIENDEIEVVPHSHDEVCATFNDSSDNEESQPDFVKCPPFTENVTSKKFENRLHAASGSESNLTEGVEDSSVSQVVGDSECSNSVSCFKVDTQEQAVHFLQPDTTYISSVTKHSEIEKHYEIYILPKDSYSANIETQSQISREHSIKGNAAVQQTEAYQGETGEKVIENESLTAHSDAISQNTCDFSGSENLKDTSRRSFLHADSAGLADRSAITESKEMHQPLEDLWRKADVSCTSVPRLSIPRKRDLCDRISSSQPTVKKFKPPCKNNTGELFDTSRLPVYHKSRKFTFTAEGGFENRYLSENVAGQESCEEFGRGSDEEATGQVITGKLLDQENDGKKTCQATDEWIRDTTNDAALRGIHSEHFLSSNKDATRYTSYTRSEKKNEGNTFPESKAIADREKCEFVSEREHKNRYSVSDSGDKVTHLSSFNDLVKADEESGISVTEHPKQVVEDTQLDSEKQDDISEYDMRNGSKTVQLLQNLVTVVNTDKHQEFVPQLQLSQDGLADDSTVFNEDLRTGHSHDMHNQINSFHGSGAEHGKLTEHILNSHIGLDQLKTSGSDSSERNFTDSRIITYDNNSHGELKHPKNIFSNGTQKNAENVMKSVSSSQDVKSNIDVENSVFPVTQGFTSNKYMHIMTASSKDVTGNERENNEGQEFSFMISQGFGLSSKSDNNAVKERMQSTELVASVENKHSQICTEMQAHALHDKNEDLSNLDLKDYVAVNLEAHTGPISVTILKDAFSAKHSLPKNTEKLGKLQSDVRSYECSNDSESFSFVEKLTRQNCTRNPPASQITNTVDEKTVHYQHTSPSIFTTDSKPSKEEQEFGGKNSETFNFEASALDKAINDLKSVNRSCTEECPKSSCDVSNRSCTEECPKSRCDVSNRSCTKECPKSSCDVSNRSCTEECPKSSCDVSNRSCTEECPKSYFDVSNRSCTEECPKSRCDVSNRSCTEECPKSSCDVSNRSCTEECPKSSCDVSNSSCIEECPKSSFDVSNRSCTEECPKSYFDVSNRSCTEECPKSRCDVSNRSCTEECPKSSCDVSNRSCTEECPKSSCDVSNRSGTEECPKSSFDVSNRSGTEECPKSSCDISSVEQSENGQDNRNKTEFMISSRQTVDKEHPFILLMSNKTVSESVNSSRKEISKLKSASVVTTGYQHLPKTFQTVSSNSDHHSEPNLQGIQSFMERHENMASHSDHKEPLKETPDYSATHLQEISNVLMCHPISDFTMDLSDSQICQLSTDFDQPMDSTTSQNVSMDNKQDSYKFEQNFNFTHTQTVKEIEKRKAEGKRLVDTIMADLLVVNKQLQRMKREMETVRKVVQQQHSKSGGSFKSGFGFGQFS